MAMVSYAFNPGPERGSKATDLDRFPRHTLQKKSSWNYRTACAALRPSS